MKKFRFYIAWVEDSVAASGDETRIHSQEDLIPEFKKGNDYVWSFDVEAENEDQAEDKAYRKCFFENYTAQDSVSTIEEIE